MNQWRDLSTQSGYLQLFCKGSGLSQNKATLKLVCPIQFNSLIFNGYEKFICDYEVNTLKTIGSAPNL